MDLPAFLTVPEAARILRIGRTVAYEQAVRYEATGGAEGIPVVRVGRQLRVPTARLEAMAGRALGTSTERRRRSSRRTVDGQSTLPVE